jgi:hypothetical protein
MEQTNKKITKQHYNLNIVLMILEVELCKSLGNFTCFRFLCLQAELPVAYPVLV